MNQQTDIALMAAIALPAPQDGSDVPEWIHLLPAPVGGMVQTVDARGPYRITGSLDEIIAASFARADKIEIDINHATYIAAPKGLRSDACGWIVEMQARADGIWGRVEWTKEGKDLVGGKAYRAISPVLILDPKDSRSVLAVGNASLVNRPNMRGLTALNQEDSMSFMETLAAKLGLKTDASEADVLAALQVKPDVALQAAMAEIGTALGVAGGDTVSIVAAAKAKTQALPAEIVALQAQLVTVTTELNTIKDTSKRDKAVAFVDGATAKGRVGVTPSRDRFIAMHMQDASGCEAIINNLPIIGPSGMQALPPVAADGTISLNAQQMQAADLLGISHAAYLATLKAEQSKSKGVIQWSR